MTQPGNDPSITRLGKIAAGEFVVRVVPPLDAKQGRRRPGCSWRVVGEEDARDLASVLAAGYPSRWVDVSERESGRLVARIEPSAVVNDAAQGSLL